MSEAGQLIVLGGRRFKVIDFDRRTVRQDHYLRREMAASGMDKAVPMDGESAAMWKLAMQAALINSGRAPELIAGYLLPDGITEGTWTQEIAADTARHINSASTMEDRELIDDMAMECAANFFMQAAKQLTRFLDSLAARENNTQVQPGALVH